jgi:ADP-ribosylglycohydrolase
MPTRASNEPAHLVERGQQILRVDNVGGEPPYARPVTSVSAARLSTVRGGLLGLMLGDALGAAGQPGSGILAATCAGQLACFTAEGLIRASVRFNHKGTCHPPSVVWHAYTRWAALQGVTGIKRWRTDDWPDGWLAHVPALRTRHGTAPATLAALQGHTMGTPDKPVGTSLGAHALTRTLPVGLTAWWLAEPTRIAREIAATTHALAAADIAALGTTILLNLAQGHPLDQALDHAQSEGADRVLNSAFSSARSHPADTAVMRQLAPDARASSALAAGIYVAASFPHPAQVRDALLFAADARDGRHVAAVTGALLGTAHGADALPVDLVSRLELAWVADVLAHDMVSEFTDSPSGTEYSPATDPTRWNRYPGW